jgi:hypothetical protein
MNEEAEKNRKRVEIANALAALAIGDFPEKLRALADAVRAGEWEDIAEAARQHIEPPAYDDEAALHCIRWIAANAHAFGIEQLTKGDVLLLMKEVDPTWKDWQMPNPRRTWKLLGLDHLPQAHGDGISQAKMMAARARWEAEKRAEIAAIRGKLPRC